MRSRNTILTKSAHYAATIGALVLFFSGCVNTPSQYEPPQLTEVSIQRINSQLAEGDPVRAVEDYYRLREVNKDGLSGGEIEDLELRIREELQQELQSYIEESMYSEAIRLYISAVQAGWEEQFEKINLETLMRDRIIDLVDREEPIRALAYVRQLDNLDVLTDDDLLKILEIAIQEKKYPVVRRIVESLDERNVSIEAELPGDEAYRYSQAELIKGTVTIWVNRGMRIQEGVGLPDRVIGSGFYIDRRGYIITNYHVIQSQVDPEYEGYSRLYIRPSEDPEVKIPARVVGWDTVFDIALLKVETETDIVFSFTADENQAPGERIYAIGSPAGLENTITSGIVSATDRRFLQMGNVMQVDVPINQGNSGGPLLNEDGNLIGVVFAGIEQFEGINFAIPVKWLIHILPDLYDEGKVNHPFLGVSLQKVGEELEVTYVLPGSSADRIGMEAGDVLTKVAGREIKDIVEAHDAILDYSVGTLIKVSWKKSGGMTLEAPTMLDERPKVPLEMAIQYDSPENLFAPAFGMQVEKIQDNLLGTRYIVEKVYQGSIADDTGMSVNDPFSLQQWKYIEDEKLLLAQVRIKKRKAGFLETGVQLGTYTETTNFL
ncbi:MAG: trypsin-like peptidase domain-containing protein [Spirochaetota bacterium]|nr:trypsin-like peptidase domain-containing protein [Spirochaetota bacterium]